VAFTGVGLRCQRVMGFGGQVVLGRWQVAVVASSRLVCPVCGGVVVVGGVVGVVDSITGDGSVVVGGNVGCWWCGGIVGILDILAIGVGYSGFGV
jgi:hypothetical protein